MTLSKRRLKQHWGAIVLFIMACILLTLTLDTLNKHIRFLQFPASSKRIVSGLIEDPDWKHQKKYCQTKTQHTSIEDILGMKPFQYLPNFKNPCWKDLKQTIKCLPYFMLIGMDKSGSSDLFDRLTKHPEIKGNTGVRGKETMWWSWTRYGLWLTEENKQQQQNLNDYTSYFDGSAADINNTTDDQGYHNLITGDGTPMDMWDFRGWPQIPQNLNKTEPEILTPHLIRHLYPEMKFIIILRNPIDRLYSDYFFLKLGKPTRAAFSVAVSSSLQILNACSRVNSFRKCLYDANLHYQWNSKARIHLGFYYVYLLEWFEVFPRDQFIILKTEDYSKDMSHHLLKLYKFLGVGELSMKQMHSLGILSKKHTFETREKQKISPMLDLTREELLKLYTPYNNRLAAMLNDSRFRW